VTSYYSAQLALQHSKLRSQRTRPAL